MRGRQDDVVEAKVTEKLKKKIEYNFVLFLLSLCCVRALTAIGPCVLKLDKKSTTYANASGGVEWDGKNKS